MTGFGQRGLWPFLPFQLIVESSSKGVMWVTKWKATGEDDSTRWTEPVPGNCETCIYQSWTAYLDFTFKASLLFKAPMHSIFCPLKQFVAQRHHTSLPDCSVDMGLVRMTPSVWNRAHTFCSSSALSSHLSWKVTFSGMFLWHPGWGQILLLLFHYVFLE